MAKIKPVFVMNQDGVSELERQAVFDGVEELTAIAGVDLEIVDFGVWRPSGWKTAAGKLTPHNSVDWYLAKGALQGRGAQLNAATIYYQLAGEPLRNSNEGGIDHYDILVVHQDLFDVQTKFLVGAGGEGIGAVVSTHRFRGLEPSGLYNCVKTETMHELGHVFGLVFRGDSVAGGHCQNKCIMRPGITVPTDWIKYSIDRREGKALCNPCESELRNYFVN